MPRIFPTSLAGRTVLLVVAVVAVTAIVTLSFIGEFRRSSHVKQMVRLVASEIRLLQVVLPGLDEHSRRVLAAADAREQSMQLRPDSDKVPPHSPQFRFAHRLAVGLGARLGEAVVLRHGGAGDRAGLWIGFLAGGERWWLLLPPPGFEPQDLSREFWQGLAFALAAVLLIAGLFVRGIVRPLARLGDAVAATGEGAARTVTPSGPREVRRLAERHNTMLAQLASAAAEKREMLAGLTHDLRAPLARLRVRLALLENDSERAGLARDLDDMERTVGQCLAFLRSDDRESIPEPLAVEPFLRDEVARQRELGRPVDLVIEQPAASRRVAIAAGNLQRLLDNLIDNALQHGEPPVEVCLAAENEGFVALSVRDHGPGIADGDRERALAPFAQLAPARATDGSCGLGLAIVRRLALACGGDVRLADAPGGGLLVLVQLPVCWSPVADAALR